MALGIAFSGLFFAAVSCSSDKPAESTGAAKPASGDRSSRTVAVIEGEAGGVVEDTFTASATVRGVDRETRKITLEGESGSMATFTAPAEMRNLDQLQVGDKVKAKIAQRVTVYVKDSGTPGHAQESALVTAPKGAKPGAMYAESFEVTGTVKSIDSLNRLAKLEFADGDTYTVPVRKDVDLTKYKVGDRIVIRVTERLAVITESP